MFGLLCNAILSDVSRFAGEPHLRFDDGSGLKT